MNQTELMALIEYNPNTGEFTHLGKITGRAKRKTFGTKNSAGYPRIYIQGKSYLCSRLAFLYMAGYMPKEVDHIDRNPANTKWDNLRASNRVTNNYNRGVQKNNKLGIKGVSKTRDGKYIAVIQVNKNYKYLGRFDCPAAAHFVYQIAADKYHGEFARAS